MEKGAGDDDGENKGSERTLRARRNTRKSLYNSALQQFRRSLNQQLTQRELYKASLYSGKGEKNIAGKEIESECGKIDFLP